MSLHPTSPQACFRGLWLPLVTPFLDDGTSAVDHGALSALVRHYHGSGIAGYVACGSTAEAAALDASESDAVLATVLGAAQGLPVVMGVSECHLGRALARVQALNALPLAGILVPAPHYIRPSQAGLLQWFTAIADLSVHPVIVYDIPYRTGTVLELSTLHALAGHPRILALKDCGGDAAKTQALIADGRLQVLAGEDAQIFATLALGGAGAIAASAHAHTRHFVEMMQRLDQGDLVAARALWQPLQPHIAACFAEPNPAPIKAWLARQGRMRAVLRAPMQPACEALAQRLADIQLPPLSWMESTAGR
ncbi:MAG: dihydrodipicolinate synthase family protein [Burkholderiaceae bacterium]|jgi:4-hydroxy-tetrahydrodipicolinate synthase|nr:dihydrodipicolinate synthase family protein [Burkholderiaceae bacterium]